jgi:hypothetical protein
MPVIAERRGLDQRSVAARARERSRSNAPLRRPEEMIILRRNPQQRCPRGLAVWRKRCNEPIFTTHRIRPRRSPSRRKRNGRSQIPRRHCGQRHRGKATAHRPEGDVLGRAAAARRFPPGFVTRLTGCPRRAPVQTKARPPKAAESASINPAKPKPLVEIVDPASLAQPSSLTCGYVNPALP